MMQVNNKARKSQSSNTPLSEISMEYNGNGPYRITRQSSLPSGSEGNSNKRKKVNKKFHQVSCVYILTGGILDLSL